MNREELLALVAEYEKQDKPFITLPREDVKELLANYKPEGNPVPWIGEIYSA